MPRGKRKRLVRNPEEPDVEVEVDDEGYRDTTTKFGGEGRHEPERYKG